MDVDALFHGKGKTKGKVKGKGREGKGKGKDKGKGKGEKSGGDKKHFDGSCRWCGRRGHRVADC
eukprot:7746103-Prorocentrum_lima.AAC.1